MKTLISIILVCTCWYAFAQESRLEQAIIQKAEQDNTGIWRFALTKPTSLTGSDMTGLLIGKFDDANPTRNRILAYANVSITTTQSTGSIESFDEFKPGDYIILLAGSSEKPVHSGKLNRLANTGQFLLNAKGDVYYTLIQSTTGKKAWEDQTLTTMLAEIKKSEASASQTSLNAFLTSIELVPQLYWGRKLYLVDEYKHWVKTGSPDFSLIETLVNAGETPEFDAIKKANADKLTSNFILQGAIGSNIQYSFKNISSDAHSNTLNALIKLLPGKLTNAEVGLVLNQVAFGLNLIKSYEESAKAYALTAQYQEANSAEQALALTHRADALYNGGFYSQSLEQYQEASMMWRSVYKKNASNYIGSQLALSLEGIVNTTLELEQVDNTLTAYRDLLPIYKKLNKNLKRGNTYWNIGYSYATKQKQPNASNENYERAYQVFDSIKQVRSAVIVLCNQGINWRGQENYKKALELGMRAEAYARANLNAEMEGYALSNQMDTYAAMQNPEKATEAFKNAEKKYKEAGATERLADLYDTQATQLSAAEKHKEAAQASRNALTQYEQFATGKVLADAYWNAGYYVAYGGDLTESNKLYEKAIAYFKDVNVSSAASLYANIGVNYRDAGDSTNCFNAHREALALVETSTDTASMIKNYEKFYSSYKHFRNFKGMVKQSAQAAYMHILTKNSDKAKVEYEKTLEALDSIIAEKETVKAYGEASKMYSLKSEIYEILGDQGNKAQSIFYTGYELTYTNQPDALPKAIRYYKKAQKIYETLPDYKHVVIYIDIEAASKYKSLKKLDSAYYHLDHGIAWGEKNEQWKNLGDAYTAKAEYRSEEKKYEGAQGALQLYEKAAEAYGKVPDIGKKSDALKAHAKLLNELNRYEAASKKHLQRLNEMDKKDVLALADVYWDYAYALSNIPARRKESNENYLKAGAIYKKEGKYTSYVSLMANISINYQDMNDSVNAYKTMRELLNVVKGDELTGWENHYNALEKFGFAYKRFGHHSQAMKVRTQAAEGFKSLGNFEKAYNLFEDAGKSANAAKQHKEAERLYRQSLAMAEQLGAPNKRASAMWSLAYNKGSYEMKSREALPMWEEAYTFYLQAGDTANASIMRSNVGQENWTLFDFDKAIENHQKAIDLATKGKYLTQVTYSWRKLADLYKKTDNAVMESKAISKAIETAEILKDTAELISSYFDIAASLASSQEIAKADGYMNKALTMAIAKKDSTNIGMAYFKLGAIYFAIDIEKAATFYSKAAPIQRKIGEQSNLIVTMASHGSLIMEKDRVKSEKMLNDAIALATKLQDNAVLAYCHSRLYDLYRTFGKPDVAHKHWETSTQLYKNNNDLTSVTNNYISLANEYLYDYGDFGKSQEYMNKAKSLLDSIKNPLTNAYFFGQQADTYADQGEYDLAIASLDKSSDIYVKMKNDWGLAGNYIEYGNIYRSLNEYALALKYQGMSDSIYQALHLEYQRLAPIANTGDVYFDQGNYPKALEYFKRSLKYMEDNKDQNTNICKMYSALGITYNNMTQYEEAEKWLLKGLDISKKINATRVRADILDFYGKLKIETKKFDEAEKYLLEAKSYMQAQKLMIERTANATNLGHLYVIKGDLNKAKVELDEAITLGEKFGKDAVLWDAYYRMGMYYHKSNKLKEARTYLLKSVGVIEKLRNNVVGGEEAKKLFSSDKWIMEAYEELIAVLLEMGETEEAMAWLQKINENNVRDKIRSMDVTFEDDNKNKALAQEKEMKMKLETLEKQIAAQKQAKNQNAEQLKSLESIRTVAEGDYLKFVNQQVNVQPELSKYFSNTVQPSQLKGKKKSIPKDMALVSYLVGEKQLYIFVATSDTVVARIVNVTKEKIHRDVTAMINITKSHLGNFGKVELTSQEAERKEIVKVSKQTDQVLKPFEDSYHYLISPISELISNKSKLGIIATGELNYIPFQLLGKTLSNGKFSLLINQHSLFYTNSTDMLLRVAPQHKDINILAFGNPDKTLPATEKEVKDIQAIFPNTKIYLRDEATEDRAKYASEEFNVMHFATHGSLDYEDFSKSYLTMAGNTAKNEDGMLTLEELWGMEVMSHLNIVVLSACQTAVTKGSDESSPVSPASGFLQNGVKSVIATLWKVDDEATSLLMNDFYTNIKTMDAVDAMRTAQSKLANNPKFAHPYYWGAMVLIGDWR